MTCSKCGKNVGDNMLTCIACTLKANDDAIRRAQYEPLLMVVAGRGDLKGCRCGDMIHVRMFHSDVCFCGRPAELLARKRFDIAWGSDVMNRMCRLCRNAIDEILAEAQKAAVA